MAKITDIVRQKRNTSRVSVFLDGEFFCGLDAVTAVGARLKIGDEITAEELKATIHKSEVNSAFERAASYIFAVPRSGREIEKYLKDKGYDGDVVTETVDRLKSYRYIDDRAYAKAYIASKSKKYGKIRLSVELGRRGVDSDIINDLLSGEPDDEYGEEKGYEEEEGAELVARRYLRSHSYADAQKLKRFLAGRGFTWDCINAAVRTLGDEGAFFPPDDDAADDGFTDE